MFKNYTISFMNLLTATVFIVRQSFSSSMTSSGLKQPDDVSDDEKLCRTIKIVAVSKFIK